MGTRLFDLDLQLVADSILCLIAFLILAIIFIGIPALIIHFIRKTKRKTNCEDCPYKKAAEKTV